MTGLFAAAAGIPVDPDAPQARQWLLDELAKPEYQAAKPTPLDLLAKAVQDWFNSLQLPQGPGGTGVLAVIGLVLLIAVIVVALLVYGAPRRARARRGAGGVFAGEDVRSASELRRAAAAAAAAGQWDAAVCDRFRGMARSLHERTVVMLLPGTTAGEVASAGSRAFPAWQGRLADAARIFDRVRYLGHAASAADYEAIAALDDALGGARPAHAEAGALA